jgi:hypothetical protein
MNKKWLEKLAAQVDDRYGRMVRDRIFGDIPRFPLCYERDGEWVRNFIRESMI